MPLDDLPDDPHEAAAASILRELKARSQRIRELVEQNRQLREAIGDLIEDCIEKPKSQRRRDAIIKRALRL